MTTHRYKSHFTWLSNFCHYIGNEIDIPYLSDAKPYQYGLLKSRYLVELDNCFLFRILKGSRHKTLSLGFTLVETHQQEVPTIFWKLTVSFGLELAWISCIVWDATTTLPNI